MVSISNKLAKKIIELHCYIEEYEPNKARLREKVTDRAVRFSTNNPKEFIDYKLQLLNFMNEIRMIHEKYGAGNYFNNMDTEEYIYVSGHVIKEDSNHVEILLDNITEWHTELPVV